MLSTNSSSDQLSPTLIVALHSHASTPAAKCNVLENFCGKQNAKQKHLGHKKCEANQKQHCKQVGATKNFDVSYGQEVFNSLNGMYLFITYFSQV